MWTPDICLYHFPCDDGFAAAWVVHRKWPEVMLVPTNYGLPFPDIDIVDKRLLIVDFSYKPDVLAGLATRAHSIIILDHHKTAEADLRHVQRMAFPGGCDEIDRHFPNTNSDGVNVLAGFDMSRSGASLAWEFCFPRDPMPQLIRYVEDRDLWRMKLDATRCISLYLRSHPYDLEIWGSIASALETNAGGQVILAEATAIERFYDRKLAEIIPTATLRQINRWKGVPVAHAPYAFASDLAHELLTAYPAAPFAAVIVDAYGARTYSLRSEDSREDVSEVARLFGGGGHRNAASFRVPA